MLASTGELPLEFQRASVDIGPHRILREVSLSIAPGRPTAVVGPNGSGKSTLLRLAMGLLEPTRGRLLWGGRSAGRLERRAMLFQRPVLFRRSVADNIAYALRQAGCPRAGLEMRVQALVEQVGLRGLEARSARRLSGGEQQKLALARAFAREPELLLLDEPTAALDPASSHAIETIITDAAARRTKIIFASHDLGQVRRLAGDVHLLVGGRLLESAPVEQFFTSPATPQAAAFQRGDILADF